MNISLRADEKIYVNGAVLRVDRKVSIELLNDVTFLLKSHVMQANDATTPLRQDLLRDPDHADGPGATPAALELSRKLIDAALRTFESREILSGLKAIDEMVVCARYFDAMKALRALFPAERASMNGPQKAPAPHAA